MKSIAAMQAQPIASQLSTAPARRLGACHGRLRPCSRTVSQRSVAHSTFCFSQQAHGQSQKHEQQAQQPQQPAQRLALAATAAALAAALLAGPATAAQPAAPLAAEGAAPSVSAGGSEAITPIYFGNGCFWGRQYDFVQTEKALGRGAADVSAVVGYAGGRQAADKVCYYYADQGTVYEELGHAEVVKVDLRGDQEAARQQYRAFARTYFSQFRRTPFGMIRLDPQDMGPGYRNVVGLPGGVDSPFFSILQEENKAGMRLLPGEGNLFDSSGRPAEGDVLNTVWVLDSNKLGFNRAEQYHQFHNGIGEAFPAAYTQDLKRSMAAAGKIAPTGCPEYGGFFSGTTGSSSSDSQ